MNHTGVQGQIYRLLRRNCLVWCRRMNEEVYWGKDVEEIEDKQRKAEGEIEGEP